MLQNRGFTNWYTDKAVYPLRQKATGLAVRFVAGSAEEYGGGARGSTGLYSARR